MRVMFRVSVICAALSVCATSGVVHAQTSSPRMKGALDYEIGGGYTPRTPSKTIRFPDPASGSLSWKNNLQCGDMDPQISVSSQLNGVTDGFKQLFGNILQASTAAVASLPALILQRSNPGLYSLLSQGIVQGKIDFDATQVSCQTVLDEIDSHVPWEKMRQSSAGNLWARAIESSEGDANEAQERVDNEDAGNQGVDWVCNNKAGGVGQQSIQSTRDVVLVGYNTLIDREDTQRCLWSEVYGTEVDSPMVQYWRNPSDAALWAQQVLGNYTIRTCDACDKIVSSPGKGLTYKLVETKDDVKARLDALIDGTTSPITYDKLLEVSAPPGVMVTGVLIRKLERYNPVGRDETIERLSNEIAYARIVEQARYMTQILKTGRNEPNVASNAAVQPYIDEAIASLRGELDLIDREIVTRKLVAKETIARLLASEEQKIQETSRPSSVNPSTVNSIGGGGER